MNIKGELFSHAIYAVLFQLTPRIANIVVFILLGRLSGANEAGIFTLAATYLLILTAATRGLDDLVVRQVSRESSQALTYLANFTFLRIVIAVTLYVLLVTFVGFGVDYNEVTTRAILIMGLSLVPDSLSFVAQSVLLGQRRFRGSAAIVTLASLLKLVGGTAIVISGGRIEQIAWFWLLASSIGMIGHWSLVLAGLDKGKFHSHLKISFLKSMWRTAALFTVITALVTLETQMDTVILSAYRGETEVAWFGAATTIAYSLILISQAYRFSVYPLMTRYAQKSDDSLTLLYDNSIQILSTLVLPMVAGIIVIAPQIVPFIFGDEFSPSILVLQILIVALIFIFLNEPNIRMMLVHDRQKWISIILVITVSANILLNLILAQLFGAVGSAVARLSSVLILFVLTSIYVRQNIIRSKLLRLIIKPLIAALLMFLILLIIRHWPWPILVAVGAFVYLVILKAIGGFPPITWRELVFRSTAP